MCSIRSDCCTAYLQLQIYLKLLQKNEYADKRPRCDALPRGVRAPPVRGHIRYERVAGRTA
jgi:hypothetical protein